MVRDLEDHDATPDLFAVAFYGPPAFRKGLPVLPEATADGKPTRAFMAVPYWPIHHLRDPKHWATLSAPNVPGGPAVDLPNASPWLDLTPVIRLRPVAVPVRATLDGTDVTAALTGPGLTFNRDRRLAPGTVPGTARRLILHCPAAADLTFDLYPHPSEMARVNQTLTRHVGPPTAVAAAR